MSMMTKTKEPKPKTSGLTEQEKNLTGGYKLIIINSIITIVIMSIFVGIMYFMTFMIKTIPDTPTVGYSSDIDDTQEKPVIQYKLDDLIINLNNPKEKRYLKVKTALEIPISEKDIEEIKKIKAGTEGENKGGFDPKAYYDGIMEQYKIPIQDIIITKLSSMSAEDLGSTVGKQQAKDEIKTEINNYLPVDRQVQRISFGEFIIQ